MKILASLSMMFVYVMFTISITYARQPLKFVSIADFPPYSYEENGKEKGIDIDIIKEMAKRTEMKIKIQPLPPKRALMYIKKGVVDGGFSALKSAKRQEYAIYTSAPIHKSVYKIFVKKGRKFRFTVLSDLYGKTIGKNKQHLVPLFSKTLKEMEEDGTIDRIHDRYLY